MAGNVTEESGVGRSLEGVSCGQQQYQAGEALAEWRSSEQVENGITSTSPPYWDSDDGDDGGMKPSELYGKYTWKIDKFSQINKRELRSNAFEVGGYKWYILIYPQGCDVCNHLSLFLCVANHEKLLPGWSHFAQFTIAVVNKDPKKSKYSDTLHRFWKKEHDWGWKKFMELSKVLDGFIDADTLIIKAQVQVIRERPDRPFRCLDCQYRRELVRVYLTNVEQICRRFVEERRGKLGKLIEDKARWSSFCTFWLGMDQSARRRMTREKADSILKVVVKNFFIEKEVTSTLVMDSLYSGLKALEGQTKVKKGKGKYLDAEELPFPIVRMEKDTFVLVDDVLLLLERVSMEPLPPKDEKGLQNRTKDGSSGEDFNKDSIERDERRLTELGRRTIEIFVLAHIFSKIEVSYQEAVALKRQEELIREEEASWLAGSEQKAKRGAAEKEKKSKKKQGKQKKNNRKAKDKGKDEQVNLMMQDYTGHESPPGETEESEALTANPDAAEEDISDISDSIECVAEVLQPDLEEKDTSPVNWDTDTSEVHQLTDASNSRVSVLSTVKNGIEGRSSHLMDDSSSTCSMDSVQSASTNGFHKGNQKSKKSPSRGQNQQGKATRGTASWGNGTRGESFEAVSDAVKLNDASGRCKMVESKSQASVLSLNNHLKSHEQHVTKEVVSQPWKPSAKNEADAERPSNEKPVPPSPRSPSKDLPPVTRSKMESKNKTAADPIPSRKPTLDIPKRTAESAPLISSADSKAVTNRIITPKPSEKPSVQQVPITSEKPSTQQVPVTTEKPSTQQVPVTTEKPSTQQVPVSTEKPSTQQVPVTTVMSRPLSAPLVPGPRAAAPVVSMVQTTPLLSRSASAAGRLGPDPSAAHSYIPQSYRNVMMGNSVASSSAGLLQPHSQSSVGNSPHLYSQPATAVSTPLFLPQCSERMESNSYNPSFSFGMPHHDFSQNGPQWLDSPPRDSSRNMTSAHPYARNEIRNMDMYNPVHSRSQENIPSDIQTGTSGRHSVMADEFPHLDIINDLLDDEYGIEMATTTSSGFHSFNNGPQHLNRHFSFPGEMGMPNDVGPSTSSCRFERTRSHREDGLQRGYGFSGAPFDAMMDMIPQSRPYTNGQIDGTLPNQWQMVGSDLSYLSLRSTENDGYTYQMPDYPNISCGVNGYSVFRPSNGH